MSQAKVIFTDDFDLTDAQIDETRQTYLQFAENYANQVERVPDAASRIQSLSLNPFLKKYQELKLDLPILFIGAGSGRDLQTTQSRGIACIGVDTSPAMIKLAKSLGMTSPYYHMDMRNLEFSPNTFGGIFCETAISHIKKADQQTVLSKFYDLLTANGTLFLGVRIGPGRVYYTEDEVGGKRYNTTTTQPEVEQMIKTAGFKILASPLVHIAGRPDMIDYLLQK